jgi:hypothetical protein
MDYKERRSKDDPTGQMGQLETLGRNHREPGEAEMVPAPGMRRRSTPGAL